MRTKNILAVALTVATLAACAPTYVNPHVTQQQADLDTAQCQMGAMQAGGLPIDMASAAMSGMQRGQYMALCLQSKGYRRQ